MASGCMNGVDPIKILESGLHSMDSTSLEPFHMCPHQFDNPPNYKYRYSNISIE